MLPNRTVRNYLVRPSGRKLGHCRGWGRGTWRGWHFLGRDIGTAPPSCVFPSEFYEINRTLSYVLPKGNKANRLQTKMSVSVRKKTSLFLKGILSQQWKSDKHKSKESILLVCSWLFNDGLWGGGAKQQCLPIFMMETLQTWPYV